LESAITASPYVETVAVSLPLTESKFDNDKKATFRAAIAAAAGVSSADVTIVKVTSTSSAQQGGEIHDARGPGIRVNMSVRAASHIEADTLCAKLTVTSMNAKLQQAGLPAATLLEAAMTAPSEDGYSTSYAATSGGMLPAIISAATGLVLLLTIVVFFYEWYHKKNANIATAISDLASAELGMRPQTTPAARPSDIEAHVGTAGVPAGNLCVHFSTTNEV